MPKPQPNPLPQVDVDLTARVRELNRLSEQYATDSHALPGRTREEHRALVRTIFADLAQVLPLLEGPQPGRIFSQQMTIIEASRAQLATGSPDLSPEPTIDTGLRAAYSALAGIAQKSYFDQAELAPKLDALSAKINDLDTVRGPLHSVVVTEAVDLSSQIIGKMADVLGQRVASGSATEPATEPTSAPAVSGTQPSAAPATAPATAPAAP